MVKIPYNLVAKAILQRYAGEMSGLFDNFSDLYLVKLDDKVLVLGYALCERWKVFTFVAKVRAQYHDYMAGAAGLRGRKKIRHERCSFLLIRAKCPQLLCLVHNQ